MAGRRHRRAPARARTYTVYVVELREDAWTNSRKLRDENPRGSLSQPCVYVGYTGKTPEERFEDHRGGGRLSAPLVHRYGVRMRPDLFGDTSAEITTTAEAEAAERAHAERLRSMGLRVWQK